MGKYDALFTPCRIGRMEVKNRIVMSPMGTNAANSDGSIADNRIDYYAARAKGGAGLIIAGCQFISEDLTSGCIEGVLRQKYVIPRLSVLCESVHRHGAKICAQLSCGVGRNAFPERFNEPLSASAIPAALDPNIICREMSKEQIAEIMTLFTNAAANATAAGFDAIEIHAHAGYLIDQFLSPLWNKRTDEYGGDIMGRTRFAREVVAAIRKGCRADMPIIFRIALEHCFPGGRTIEESLPLLPILQQAGVDAFDVDAGAYEAFEYIFPTAYLGDACYAQVAAPAKSVVDVPVMNSGNHTPETALALIEQGAADFVMFGRPLIADPELPKKLREERREDIRPCIRCNEDCIGRTAAFKMSMLSCAVNPEACQEKWMRIEPAETPLKVCVVGGGPAGLEAARAAAIAGHQVTLFEAEAELGGQLTAAYTPAFKSQLRALVQYYQVQLDKLGVTVQLNTRLSADDTRLDNFDRYIIAIGAEPVHPPIPGVEGANVVNVLDAHRHKHLVKGQHIVVCGGGLSGCDCAIELATEYGKSVQIVEMLPQLAPSMIKMNRSSLDRILSEQHIGVFTNSRVEAITGQGVQIRDARDAVRLLPADTVIDAFGMKSRRDLAEAWRQRFGWRVRLIGDCDSIGRVGTAVRAGYFAGSTADD